MPVRDRFEEFQLKQKLLNKAQKNMSPVKCTTHRTNIHGNLNDFLCKASRIDTDLSKYKSDISDMKRLQQDILCSPFVDNSRHTRYHGLIACVSQQGLQIRTSIRDLESDAETLILNTEDMHTRDSVCKQRTQSLNLQLIDSTTVFLTYQTEYDDKMKDRLKRQLHAKGEGEVSDEQVNKILGAAPYNVFTENFISEQENALKAYKQLVERHKDIISLEESVSDVNELFKILNMYVSTQGDHLNNIETHLNDVEVNVEAGNLKLGKAVVSQSKSRRKKFCCFGAIALILIILLIIILVSTQLS